jgi:hypothetical protein
MIFGLVRRKHEPINSTPRPLLDPDRRLMFLWSAKSACTTTFVWFAHSIGQLADLKASGQKVHQYRKNIYYDSPLHERGRAIPLQDYRIVHVMRDPAARAVSSYRHALRTGYEDSRLSAYKGAALDRQKGFSFNQFLAYLETLDLTTCNQHHRLQRHPIELSREPDQVIDVSTQDLLAELDKIGAGFGLAPIPSDAMTWLHDLEGRRAVKPGEPPTENVPDTPFDEAAARGNRPWPGTSAFLTPETRARIAKLYAPDFDLIAKRR